MADRCMGNDPHIKAALSAAGAAFAEHLRLGDRLSPGQIASEMVPEANHSLRCRGLVIVDAGVAGWVVQTIDGAYGIWCVEWKDWCKDHDGTPVSFHSQEKAELAADGWRRDNHWQTDHGIRPSRMGVHEPHVGYGPMVQLTYQVRTFSHGSHPEDSRAGVTYLLTGRGGAAVNLLSDDMVLGLASGTGTTPTTPDQLAELLGVDGLNDLLGLVPAASEEERKVRLAMACLAEPEGASPSTTPRADRKRPLRTLSLSPEAWDRLDEIARRWAVSRSGAVERLVRESPLPREPR